MTSAVIYARVSSKDQEREGYSIPAQLKLLREYAQNNDFKVEREFVDVETAKMAGRKNFTELVRYLENSALCRVVIAEKTDRLYRNLRDCLTLEDMNVEIHLPKEGQIISKDSRSQAKLIHGIHVVLARNYIENLKEEVKKGMREKAEQGVYPSRPPLGYRNNKVEHTIEIDPVKAPIAKRMFELYATGRLSLQLVWKTLKCEFEIALSKSHVEKLLKNPFYAGNFYWDGILYPGTHEPLISRNLFDQVQAVFRGHNQPKYKKREFAFGGLLRCAYDNCTVTAEIKKNRYTYYHCTGYRGKCALPYFREEELGNRLGQILKHIHIPDDILKQLEQSLLHDKSRATAHGKAEGERLRNRLGQVRSRIEQAYLDKLDGKITEGFWAAKSSEWSQEEQQILMAVQGLEQRSPERIMGAVRTLELANRAYFLYLKQPPAEKAKLLQIVLSNCKIDATSLDPTYRKPFDLIFQRVRKEEWLPGLDSN
ncbi:MAG: recombinase family protein [Candidatus Acidiferrales bacterium]